MATRTPSLTAPDYRERLLFLGENGSGKTTLARELLGAGYPRWVAIDLKGDFQPPGHDYLTIVDPSDRRITGTKPFGYGERILFRPKDNFDGPAAADFVLYHCFRRARREGKRRPFIVYVDEGLYLAKSYRTQNLAALAVSGRSLGVGLWVASQRPAWIPIEVKSEAWRWYVFSLGYQEDEKEVLKVCKGRLTLADLQTATDNYAFIEIRRNPERAGDRLINRFPPVHRTAGE